MVVAIILKRYPDALLVGAPAGLCNGMLINKVGINLFITTFGMMVVIREMVFGITEGRSIGTYRDRPTLSLALKGLPAVRSLLTVKRLKSEPL